MKIKRIQISGFRGIPPVNSPNNVDIDLTDSSSPNEPKDLLLFGPNAYGKSSIADALEWFFKEDVRGSAYFEEYSARDNVHMKLGEPGFNQTAVIELQIVHNGNEFTVRKELGADGLIVSESLTGLQAELQKAKDEIVVLDHEQFHKFVVAANKDKWGSFSSLIGYEELDQMRGGLDSLTGNSLTANLGTEKLRKDIDTQRQKGQVDLVNACHEYGCSQILLEELRTEFRNRLETNLVSLSLEVPEIDALDQEYWGTLLERVKTPNDIVQAAERLSKFQSQRDKLVGLDPVWIENLPLLENLTQRLTPKKSSFDKEILAAFYQTGLKVLSEKKTDPDLCPFCGQVYDTVQLENHVKDKHTALNFDEIQSDHVSLKEAWDVIKTIVKNRQRDLLSSEQTAVQESFRAVADFSKMEAAVSLSDFDSEYILEWLEKAKRLSKEIDRARETVELEIPQAEIAASNPNAEIQETVNDLLRFWTTLTTLSQRKQEIERLERKFEISKQVTTGLQGAARQFRTELNDFSGRVATLINADVKNYYKELHPEDDVVPSLEVSLSGTQRQVTLKCTYKGIPDKTAVPLLSESHRNSLGMAILLSFMKYKRHIVGSPVEFCIFDDVMQSFDMEHRTNLLGLLENPNFPEICDQQIIFFTHDRTLADLVKRPGEQSVRDYWLRVDIRNWWLTRMLLESEKDSDPLQKARYYIGENDEIAAGIYIRRALEQIYKSILGKTSTRTPFSDKPWSVGMEKYREYIVDEINELWSDGKGFVDPNTPLFQQIFTSQRILNFTVHDSQFLENPMTMGDVQSALALVVQLKDRFRCPTCNTVYHTLRKTNSGSNPNCKGRNCTAVLP